MKATLISMLTVAALAVCVCLFALNRIEQAADEMNEMRITVLEMTEAGELPAAQDKLRQMAEVWRKRERELAVLVSHDTLHEIAELIIEGAANLAAKDLDDFSRSMALLGESVRHLYEEERPELVNIF